MDVNHETYSHVELGCLETPAVKDDPSEQGETPLLAAAKLFTHVQYTGRTGMAAQNREKC